MIFNLRAKLHQHFSSLGCAYVRVPMVILIACFSLIFSGSAFAETWQIFNSSNGLPGDNVLSFSANAGYLAAGTQNGLAIYDGAVSEWIIPKLPQQIASSAINDLAFDSNGNLWIASPVGLAHYTGNQTLIYQVKDGLPNVDVQRIQIAGNKIYAGCFGGYIAQANIPGSGYTSFTPFNYDAFEQEKRLKIRSVGISGLAILKGNTGYYSTKGEGYIEIAGTNEYPIKTMEGIASDWVLDFFIFGGKNGMDKTILATSNGLSLLKYNKPVMNVNLPEKEAWITSIAMISEPEETADFSLEIENFPEDNKALKKFIGRRQMFVGTRNSGLWRFRNGQWKQFTSQNGSLPSDCINRIFLVGKKIAVCTAGGLVILAPDTQMYDEFKDIGIGNPYAKTIFPLPDEFAYMFPFKQVIKGVDYWFTHKNGLSRYKTSRAVESIEFKDDEHKGEEVSSSRIEKINRGKKVIDFKPFPDLKKEKDMEDGSIKSGWQLFTDEFILQPDKRIVFDIRSNNITRIALNKTNQDLWLIFDGKHLCRMTMGKEKDRSVVPPVDIEVPNYEFVLREPWPGDTDLATVWFNDGKLYVGTVGQGFYVLDNPGTRDFDNEPYEWKSYGMLELIPETTVLGFASWKFDGFPYIAVMHRSRVSLWDGKEFSNLELGGSRKYTCIAAGELLKKGNTTTKT